MMFYSVEMLMYVWLMLFVGCLLFFVGDIGNGGLLGGFVFLVVLFFVFYKDFYIKV